MMSLIEIKTVESINGRPFIKKAIDTINFVYCRTHPSQDLLRALLQAAEQELEAYCDNMPVKDDRPMVYHPIKPDLNKSFCGEIKND